MLHPVIEKHRRGLNRFGRLVGVMGWMLVILAGVWISMKIGECRSQPEKWDMPTREWFPFIGQITSTFFLGLFSIGLGQFIQCLLGGKLPGRLLRCGYVLLLFVAVAKLLFSLCYAGFAVTHYKGVHGYDLFVMTFLFPFYRLIYGVILISLGLALRKLLPMVEESRTLA